MEHKLDVNTPISEIEKNMYNYGAGEMEYNAGVLPEEKLKEIHNFIISDELTSLKWDKSILPAAYNNLRGNCFCGFKPGVITPEKFINSFEKKNESLKVSENINNNGELVINVYTNSGKLIEMFIDFYKSKLNSIAADRRRNNILNQEIEKYKSSGRQKEINQLINDVRNGRIKSMWENLLLDDIDQKEFINDIEKTFMCSYSIRLFIISNIISFIDNKNSTENGYKELNERLTLNKIY